MTTEIEQDALAGLYEVRDAARVRAWLAEYPFLVPILRQTRPEIARLFPHADPLLAIVDDPEEASATELVVYINPQTGYAAGLDDKLDELDGLLWNENAGDTTQCRMAFDLWA